jgi:hypothetical protein
MFEILWVRIHLNAGWGHSHGNFDVREEVQGILCVLGRLKMDKCEIVNHLDEGLYVSPPPPLRARGNSTIEHTFQRFFL